MNNGKQTKTNYVPIIILSIIISSCVFMVTYAKEGSNSRAVGTTIEQEMNGILVAEEEFTGATDKLIKLRIKENKPIIKGEETTRVQVVENDLGKLQVIWHKGFDRDDIRQKYVQYSYKLGGMRQVLLQECENGTWNIDTRGDSGKAVGLCQMSELYHKIPEEYYTSWQFQVEYCNQKMLGGTKYYGPSRPLYSNGKYIGKCSDVVKSRFTNLNK